MHSLVATVIDAVHRHHLIDKGTRVLIAVSGGVDSLVLLHVLRGVIDRWDVSLYACHVHHRLRSEADDDAEHVRAVCASWGIPCDVRMVDWRADERRGSIQDRARAHRYALLIASAKAFGCSAIALGHHRDDQAETVLMRLLHGTGVHGLAAMRPRRYVDDALALIRPMLAVSKDAIESYAQEYGVAFRHDASNDSRAYVRNVVRHDVLPVLRAVSPRIDTLLCTTAAVCAAEDDVLTALAEEARARMCVVEGASVHFARQAFVSLPLALQSRLFALLLSDMNVQRKALDAARLWELCAIAASEHQTTGSWDVDAHVVLICEYERIRIARRMEAHRRAVCIIDVTSDGHVDDIAWRRVLRAHDVPWRRGALHEAWFDARVLGAQRVVVRGRMRGDRVTLFRREGSKAVSDVLIDAKVPVRVRDVVPLLAWEHGHILWMPDVYRAPYALVTDKTEEVVHMWCTTDWIKK